MTQEEWAELYRDTPEWAEVQRAVQTLMSKAPNHERDMTVDFTLTVFGIPEHEGVDSNDPIAAYSYFSTSRFPHVNVGLTEKQMQYWAQPDYEED